MKLFRLLILLFFLSRLFVGTLYAQRQTDSSQSSEESNDEWNWYEAAYESRYKDPFSRPTEEREEEIDKIQDELKDIVNRTSKLQKQARTDRQELYQILERAQIHQRILSTIKIPKPTKKVQKAQITHLLNVEKVRFIAAQTEQAQKQIQTIEKASSYKPVETVKVRPS